VIHVLGLRHVAPLASRGGEPSLPELSKSGLQTGQLLRAALFQGISSFNDRKARHGGLFLLEVSGCAIFLAFQAPESLQPNSIKLPFSGDSPWKRENKCTAW
jgi:hypothetical protein